MFQSLKQIVFQAKLNNAPITLESFKEEIRKISKMTKAKIQKKFFKTPTQKAHEAVIEYQEIEQRVNKAEEVKGDAS